MRARFLNILLLIAILALLPLHSLGSPTTVAAYSSGSSLALQRQDQGERGTSGLQTWAKSYGGTSPDRAYSIAPTSDGGYVVAGVTESFGAGNVDAWVLKLDGSGSVTWQKTYGGAGAEYAYSIVPTSDGGYVVAGFTDSFGAGSFDAWVLKLDGSGSVIWQKTYGGSGNEYAYSIVPTSDGGYIVAGVTYYYQGWSDAGVLKLDGSGNILWQKTYGGRSYDSANSIAATPDGGYIVAGYTESVGVEDAGVTKLDASGNVLWQKTYGGGGAESASSIVPTSDGGYVVAGLTGARKGDAVVMKLDGSGNILWQKTYGGRLADSANSIAATSDGGYIVAGSTQSFGVRDVWVLKLDDSGNILWQKTYGAMGDERAYSVVPTSDGGYVVAGLTESFGVGSGDAWVLKLDGSGDIGSSCSIISSSSATVISTVAGGSSHPGTAGNRMIVGVASSASVSNSNATVSTQCGE